MLKFRLPRAEDLSTEIPPTPLQLKNDLGTVRNNVGRLQVEFAHANDALKTKFDDEINGLRLKNNVLQNQYCELFSKIEELKNSIDRNRLAFLALAKHLGVTLEEQPTIRPLQVPARKKPKTKKPVNETGE